MIINKKQILEAIQRGINLAIDDFDDDSPIEVQKIGQVRHSANTRELIKYSHFVDLGLPSGTLWGKYNVGVDIYKLNRASDWYGGYYAWGEIEEKQVYSWETYKYAHGNQNQIYIKLIKYCNDIDYCDKNSKLDNLTTLLAEDDIAVQTNKLPWNVKMPTKEQFDELLKYTINEWVENYQGITGLNGRIFTSKTNGNQMFIPAAGYWAGSSGINVGSRCNLWSSSLFQDVAINAYRLWFNSSKNCFQSAGSRHFGFSIRSVLVK